MGYCDRWSIIDCPNPHDLQMNPIRTVLLYILIGPPVGLITAILILGATVELHSLWAYIEVNVLHTINCGPYRWDRECQFVNMGLHWSEGFSFSKLVGVSVLAYIVGFMPALSSGVLVALGMAVWRNFGIRHALAAGCLVGAFLIALTFNGPKNPSLQDFLLVFALSVIPTVVCWLPARRCWREPFPSHY
jgi:hypothetical protein